MAGTASPVVNHFTAWMENPNDPTLQNKIHAADGAKQYGFQAALVGGVTVYGWMVPTILEAAGESWLDHGWTELHFRRPTYPGDQMTVTATPIAEGWELSADKQTGETCIRGSAGLGDAPWLGMLERSSHLEADPPLEQKEWLTLENAPIGQDIRTMPLLISKEEAREIAKKQLRDTNPLFNGDSPLIHPYSLARNMISLVAYSYDYGRPSIHASSHIQHLARVHAGEQLALTGRFINAYERNGHHYAVVDGVYLDGVGREVARIRHTNIFKVAKRESA